MANKKKMEFEDEVFETKEEDVCDSEKATKKKVIKNEVAAACDSSKDFGDFKAMNEPPAEVLKPISPNCIVCGEAFTISPAEQKFCKAHGYELPKRCPKCRADKHKVTKVICVDCGIEFDIRNAELEYFKSKGMQIPKRCQQCRAFKRERNNRQVGE